MLPLSRVLMLYSSGSSVESVEQPCHHHPLPEQVTVLRACHALEGKSIAVLRQRLKKGQLHLLLAPSGADPVLIPADWTDFSIRKQSTGSANTVVVSSNPARTLGSIADLMQVRTVVDALLRGLSATGSDTQQQSDMEGSGATVPELPDPAAIRNPARPTRTGATSRGCPGPRRAHHQGSQPDRIVDRHDGCNNTSNTGDPA